CGRPFFLRTAHMIPRIVFASQSRARGTPRSRRVWSREIAGRRALHVAALALLSGCSRACSPDPTPKRRAARADSGANEVVAVPHVTSAIELDGELVEGDWTRAARTGPFVDEVGQSQRPYSDARFLWSADSLHLGLYAADENIHAAVTEHDAPLGEDHAFSLAFRTSTTRQVSFFIDISATGVVRDAKQEDGSRRDSSWESDIRLHVDRDGSVNDERDDDEEWVIEASIPL